MSSTDHSFPVQNSFASQDIISFLIQLDSNNNDLAKLSLYEPVWFEHIGIEKQVPNGHHRTQNATQTSSDIVHNVLSEPQLNQVFREDTSKY